MTDEERLQHARLCHERHAVKYGYPFSFWHCWHRTCQPWTKAVRPK